MAMGVFLYATIDALFFIDRIYKQGLTMGVVLLLGWLAINMARQCLSPAFLSSFFRNPVNMFLSGTWIAGVAVLVNVLFKYFPESLPVLKIIAIGTTGLYSLFLLLCLYNFKKLFQAPAKYQAHGVILLSTVTTQALVIMWVELFHVTDKHVLLVLIGTGGVFYIGGLVLISYSIVEAKVWSLADDWPNTNCIIHGALSITGLALVLAEVASSTAILGFWGIVCALLVMIESVELRRAVQRVQRYGWREGVGTYHVSQWSRNFTFGMFYAFTSALHEHFQYSTTLEQVYAWLLPSWGWLVFVVLVVECVLWIKSKLVSAERVLP